MIEPPLTDDIAELSTARAATSAGYWSEALELYRRVLSTHPAHAQALLGAAQMLRRLKRYAEAATLLDQVGSDDSADSAFRLERARLADAQGHYAQVFTLLTGLLAEGKNNASTWVGILRSLRLRAAAPGNPEQRPSDQRSAEYELWLQRALAAFPAHSSVLAECALLWIALGRHERGIALLLHANAGNLLIETIRDLPSTVQTSEQAASAVGFLNSAVNLMPSHAGLLHAAAQSFISLNQDQFAAATLARVLDLEPANQAARQLRFTCLQRAGLLTEARQVAEALLADDPANPDCRLQLAATLSSLGSFDDACRLLETAGEAAALLTINADTRALDQLLEVACLYWPDAPELLLARARRQANRGELWRAAASYGRLLEQFFPDTDNKAYRELLLLLRRFGKPANEIQPPAQWTRAVSTRDRESFSVDAANLAVDSGKNDKRINFRSSFYTGHMGKTSIHVVHAAESRIEPATKK